MNEILSVLNLALSAVGKALTKRGTRIEKKIRAVQLMQKAVNRTKLYLNESNGNYHPNAELSDLWNEAFAAMILIDHELARKLNEQSRFWIEPQAWLLEESAMELQPSLMELQDRCESIIIELQRRKT
ncbi:hypothetical protein [Lentiprolixibacter aurantiacus]|uniref:Uncharacterized protein n=1 Tax=Lentiprolixibacter aurantiacus TaxID=2993939 RepID=A0AAE3SMS7_9FLAO|nr:hypothetical protein [Lentiprolixibacter aurantiacus]MCX2718889.1 hypothetical protein [Lentiprolixibacter aurantiacus]